MSTPRKLNEMITHEDETMNPWCMVIGGLLINFGSIEFLACRWVEFLSRDIILRDLFTEMQFARRVDLIFRLLDRSDWPEKRKQTAKNVWGEARKLSETRNRVAHNPLVTHPRDKNQMTLINMKVMQGHGPYSMEAIQIDDIKNAAARLHGLATILQSLLREAYGDGNKPV